MVHANAQEAARALYDQGYRIHKGKCYKNNEKIDYATYSTLGTGEVKKALEELTDYNAPKKRDVYEAVMDLPVVSYYGRLYRDGIPMHEIEAYQLVREMNPEFDCTTIQQVLKFATIMRRTDSIPDYSFPYSTPVDNGFRFNKTAYQLIHYYLFEKKQKYIMCIMSDGNMGKSTFTNFLRYLFKDEYYSADTKSMNQFSASFYASSRLTVFSDCTSEYIENMHILKQISGGDEVQIEAKGQQAISGKIDAHVLFIGNEPLSYNVLDTGVQNRFVNLPWENDIPADKRDPKWLDYEWTPGELAFQIELARNIEPLDFEALQRQTIKESLIRKSAFYYDDYEEYLTVERKPYSRDNYVRFWKLVLKYFTKDEWRQYQDSYFNLRSMWDGTDNNTAGLLEETRGENPKT